MLKVEIKVKQVAHHHLLMVVRQPRQVAEAEVTVTELKQSVLVVVQVEHNKVFILPVVQVVQADKTLVITEVLAAVVPEDIQETVVLEEVQHPEEIQQLVQPEQEAPEVAAEKVANPSVAEEAAAVSVSTV